MRVGLVLEGGAMRGMYTAGVLDVFLEQGIKADGVIGVSAGALFGVNYLSRQSGRALRYNKRFAGDSRYMGLRSLLTTGNIINKDFAYYDVPLRLDVFDDEAFKQAGTDFYVAVTNVETGRAEYIRLTSVFEQMELLRATAAMPFVSRMVELGGKRYLDGGVADSIPVEKCLALGYDKVIVILTRPLDYRKKPTGRLGARLMYGKYPRFQAAYVSRYQNYNASVEKIIALEAQQAVFAIRPSRTVAVSRIEKDANKLQEMYDLGLSDGRASLAGLRAYLGG